MTPRYLVISTYQYNTFSLMIVMSINIFLSYILQLSMEHYNAVLQSSVLKNHSFNFVNGDINNAHSLDPFTHIYAFDIAFEPKLNKKLAQLFNNRYFNKCDLIDQIVFPICLLNYYYFQINCFCYEIVVMQSGWFRTIALAKCCKSLVSRSLASTLFGT